MRKLLAIFAIAVVVLLVGIVLLLHTPVARQFAIARVASLLQQQNVDFSTDELGYNLFALRLRLRNVRIRSHEASDLPPFASIDRVAVDLSLQQLLRGRYVLESGEAEGVSVHYFVGEDGRDNLPRKPRDPEQPSKPLDYLIEQLRIRDATVRYENRPQRVDVLMPVSSIEVTGDALHDRHTVEFASGGGTLAVQERKATVDQLSGEVELGDDDARVERLDVVAEGARVGLTGTVTKFAEPQVDLTMRGTIDARRTSEIAQLPETIAGAIDVDVTAKGRLAAPAISGHVAGRDVSFRTLSGLSFTTEGTYDMTAEGATISRIQLDAPFGSITGDGELWLSGGETSRVNATATSVDAAALMRAFRLPYVVGSRIDGKVEAEWPGLEYLEASGHATLALTPTARASHRVVPVGGRIEVTGGASALDAVLTRVTSAGIEVNGRVRLVEQRKLAGQARVAIGDVARAVSAAEAVLGRDPGALVPTRVAGRVEGNVRMDGTLESPVVRADVRSSSLAVGGASGIALDAGVTYTPAHLAVQRLDVQWQQAHALASGTVGLSGPRALDLTVRADGVQVSELLRAADQTSVPASGVVSLEGRMGGTVAQPTGALTINGSQLAAYNEAWGTLAARVDLAGRKVAVADLRIDKPQPDGTGRIEGSASYHLDRRTYALDLRSQNVRLVSLTLPNGRRVRGNLDLNARGSGSVDQPSGTVRVATDNLQIDDYAVGRVSVEALVANKQATITASVPGYNTTANALIGIARPYPASAKVRVENLQLQALPLDLETPLEGVVRASVDATGTLAAPEQIQASAVVDAFTGRWNQQPFSIEGPARFRYANERLAIDRLNIVAQDSTIEVAGELSLTGRGAPGAITVDARGKVATLVRFAPAGTNAEGSGDITVTGTLGGTIDSIDPDLTISVLNASVATPQIQPGLSNVNLRARIANGEAQIEQLGANWGDARLMASGRVPLEIVPPLPVDIPRRGGPAEFTATIQGLNLSQVPGAPQGLTGRASLNAELSSTRADLEALNGRITLPELALAFNGLTLDQQQESVISLGGGIARVERLALTGSAGTLTTSGTVGLTGDRPIDIHTSGNPNVAAIAIFTDAVRAQGDTALKVAARGTLASPELSGFADLHEASFVVDEPTIAAENVNARVVLAGRRVSIAQLTGTLNGGTLTGSGHVELGAGGIADVALEVATNDVAFDAPLDLRSMSDARVTVRRLGNEYVLEGQITLDESGLTGDINFDEGLLAALQQRRTLNLTERRNPFLERVRFDVNVDTAAPLIVDNNLARAEVTADLRLIGSPYEPGLAGRLTVLEGGVITLNERRYEVERGVITFIGERRIQPSFDLLLNTTARNYDITVAVTGTPGDTEASLTSDPTLPEPDILAMLATGRTLDEMRGEEFEVAREQMLSYLAGRVGSQLGRGAERATGLDTVRLEPNLIANETNPTARLTVGEDIADNLGLIYSVNLADSNDQIWIAEYDVTRRFQTKAVRQSDNSYRFDFRHDVRFGGRPAPARIKRQRPIVASVAVTGDGKVSRAEVRDWLGIEEGDAFDFFAARNGVAEVEETLEERGHLQSRVRFKREGDERAVDVSLDVTAGPRVDLLFEGVKPPSAVMDKIRAKWSRGVFDTQRLDDSVETIRAWLMADNYLQPMVQARIEEVTPEERHVHFGITPGPRSDKVILAFEGAKGIAAQELDQIVDEQNLELELFADPTQVTELLQRYYREQGFLVASIDGPRYEFQGSVARVVLRVQEGPRFIVRTVTANGATAVPAETLVGELPIRSGDPFLPFAAENALQHIRDVYWGQGYNDVLGDYDLVLDQQAGQVDVRFEIEEGPQTVVAGITVQGNDKTSDGLVREQVELDRAQALDLAALARSRKNLYDTQAFSLVDITREEVAAPQATNGSQGLEGDGAVVEQKPVQLNITVREVQPFQLRYGASYDTERGLGGILDLSNHNSLGKARVIGFSSRYDGELRDFRGYLTQPSLRYWPVATTATVYYRDERNPETSLTRPFNVDRRGASIQQERELADAYVWNWGMRYERARTFDPRLGAGFDEMLTVAPLTTSLTRETRDEVLDATRGAFVSQAFAYSPEWLGSDRAFIKYFGQYFHYIPLEPERRERFTNEILRPRFVYAGAVRVGLAKPFGGDLPRSERFFAGGGSTLRGFEQNAVGGVDPAGIPLGGEALFVINNEVRFPLVSIFDGVVFSDIGNVFPRISDFSFGDLRKSAGVGLRVRTRWFLVRGDYGLVLDRRAGERRGRFYFSLGQAF